MRFEEPNPMTRWDSPLFVVDCNTASVNVEGEWEDAPVNSIWEAITQGKITKAPDVVAPVRGTSTNYLSLLESVSQLVLSSMQALASFGTLPDAGGMVKLSIDFPSEATSSVQLPLHLPVGKKAPTTAALQRLRRQFVKMHAAGASAGNELGHAMGQEGRITNASRPGSTPSNSRAERKGQQNFGPATSTSKEAKSTEEEIARRFVAYLEETL